jgi:hypothetical protein
LKEYVKNGGVLVSEGRPGYVGGDGWLYDHQPGAGLNEVFGADEDLFYNTGDYKVSVKGFALGEDVYLPYLKQTYRNISGEVFMTDEEGKPCGVVNHYGKGKAYILGGLPSLYFGIGAGKYESGAGRAQDEKLVRQRSVFSSLYGQIAESAGASPVIRVNEVNPKLTAKVLETEAETLYFVMNYDNAQDTVIDFGGASVTQLTLDGEKVIGGTDSVNALEWKIYSVKK